MFIKPGDMENDPKIKELVENSKSFTDAAKTMELTDRQINNLIDHIMDQPTKEFMIAWQTAKLAYGTFKNGNAKDADDVIEQKLREYLLDQQTQFAHFYKKGRIHIMISGNAEDINDYINT